MEDGTPSPAAAAAATAAAAAAAAAAARSGSVMQQTAGIFLCFPHERCSTHQVWCPTTQLM
jgi:hypothetical protein